MSDKTKSPTSPQNSKQENNKMADTSKTQTPANKSTNGGAKPATNADGMKLGPDGKPLKGEKDGKKKDKKPRIRLVSNTVPGFWCRMYKDVADKFGMPLGPDGKALVVGAAPVGGFGAKLTPEQKAERDAAKEAAKAAEAKALASMTDEQKIAHAQAKREATQAKKAQKVAKVRDELMAQLRAEFAANPAAFAAKG